MPTPMQIKEAKEYESRLFYGGAYSPGRLRTAAKDAPIREMIRCARQRYNNLRRDAGLDPVTDWNRPPATEF